MTAHRQENVDAKNRLKGILDGLELIYRNVKFPIIYPIHPRTKKRIKEFGLEYIGLPTACLFANANHEAIGIDINQKTIEKINHNELPFEEKVG
jgi:UDP-N-acetylglucosamine 2-epimerase